MRQTDRVDTSTGARHPASLASCVGEALTVGAVVLVARLVLDGNKPDTWLYAGLFAVVGLLNALALRRWRGRRRRAA